MEKRKATLMKKAEWRSTRKLTDVGPAGSSKLDDMPDRDDFAAGAEGAAEFSEIMLGLKKKGPRAGSNRLANLAPQVYVWYS